MLLLSAGMIGLFLNLSPAWTARSDAEAPSLLRARADRLLVFVIDYESLMCGGCHPTILAFLAALRGVESPPDARILGVLRLAPTPGNSPEKDDLRIASQKLAAFRRFNRIPFPILVADCRVCGGLSGTSGVILVDGNGGLIRRWTWSEARERLPAIIHHLRVAIDEEGSKRLNSAKPH